MKRLDYKLEGDLLIKAFPKHRIDERRELLIRFFSNFGTFMYLSLRRPLSAKEKSMLFHP